MTIDISLTDLLAPLMKPYVTLIEVDDGAKPYNYEKRQMFGLPIIRHRMHLDKIRGDSIIYMALPNEVDRRSITKNDLLYVGSQSGSDRMFRGDGLSGLNFHHAEMRKGRGYKNLLTHLNDRGSVTIFYAKGVLIAEQLSTHSFFQGYSDYLRAIAESQRDKRNKKMGHGFAIEQMLLIKEGACWQWNTKGAEPHAVKAAEHLTFFANCFKC